MLAGQTAEVSAMLEIRKLRDDQADLKAALKKKNFELDIDQLQLLLKQRQQAQLRTEALQKLRNDHSKAIGQTQAQSDTGKVAELKAAVLEANKELEVAKGELERLQAVFQAFALAIPNPPDQSVPEGDDESGNLEIRKNGDLPKFSFTPKDHVDLGEQHQLLDFDGANLIVGSRFAVLKGPLARLHSALAQFMLNVHTQQHGYEEVYVPFIASAAALTGTGQLPKFEEDQFRLTGKQPRYLIPTAEVPMTNLVRDSILDAEVLPVKRVAHTACFRREAGSYGRDTRGMIRQHQFEKVELVQITRPEDSWRGLETLTAHAERILQLLNLPYRVVVLCGGDLGFAAAKTYDIEVWLPGQNAYREISSCSNFLDFQARRIQARWRNPETGKPEMVHTLNGSGLAVGRTLIAVMENYQDEQGRIQVPEVLAPWMGGIEVIG